MHGCSRHRCSKLLPDLIRRRIQLLPIRHVTVIRSELEPETVGLEPRQYVQVDVKDFLTGHLTVRQKKFIPSHRTALRYKAAATLCPSWNI